MLCHGSLFSWEISRQSRSILAGSGLRTAPPPPPPPPGKTFSVRSHPLLRRRLFCAPIRPRQWARGFLNASNSSETSSKCIMLGFLSFLKICLAHVRGGRPRSLEEVLPLRTHEKRIGARIKLMFQWKHEQNDNDIWAVVYA